MITSTCSLVITAILTYLLCIAEPETEEDELANARLIILSLIILGIINTIGLFS